MQVTHASVIHQDTDCRIYLDELSTPARENEVAELSRKGELRCGCDNPECDNRMVLKTTGKTRPYFRAFNKDVECNNNRKNENDAHRKFRQAFAHTHNGDLADNPKSKYYDFFHDASGRIIRPDVVLEDLKIVVEAQTFGNNKSATYIINRNRAYASKGYSVLWIIIFPPGQESRINIYDEEIFLCDERYVQELSEMEATILLMNGGQLHFAHLPEDWSLERACIYRVCYEKPHGKPFKITWSFAQVGNTDIQKIYKHPKPFNYVVKDCHYTEMITGLEMVTYEGGVGFC